MKNSPKWRRFHLKVFLQFPCDITGSESDYRGHRRWKLDWFPLLIQPSGCRDGFTRMYLSMGVCQQRQEAIKNMFPSFSSLLIVASLTNLAACLAVKHINQPWLIQTTPAAVVLFFLLLLFTWVSFFSGLDILTVTAAEWTERPHCFT